MKCRGKKNTSKRKSLSLQHKITKKSAEKGRKQRKEARRLQKNGVTLKRKKTTKLSIPSKWPFKREELALQKQKLDKKEDDNRAKLERQKLERLREKKKNSWNGVARPMSKSASRFLVGAAKGPNTSFVLRSRTRTLS